MSKRGENIYKRKDGRWEARYAKGYRSDGKLRYGYCYGRTYREAKEKAMHSRVLQASGKMPAAQTQRLSPVCDEWLQLTRPGVKESTFVKYTGLIEKHIRPRLGGYCVQAITTLTVGQFCRELLTESRLSPKTARDVLTLLRSVLKYAAKQAPNLPEIDFVYPKDAKTEMRVLTREEQRTFTDYLLSDMDRCKFGVLLAMLTGMRIGEICALKWGDISMEKLTVSVSRTMQRLKNLDAGGGNKTKIVISEPKSGNSRRLIPLTGFAAELCRRWQVCDPDAFVLTGSTGRFAEPRTLQYRLKKYADDCGLSGVHFHVFRHTFATRCVEVGFDVKSLSEILGHAGPRITLESYVHSSLALKRENMNKLTAAGY